MGGPVPGCFRAPAARQRMWERAETWRRQVRPGNEPPQGRKTSVKTSNMTLIYLHGFASAGEGSKCQQLRAMCPGLNVVSPTIDPDPEIGVRDVRQLIEGTAGPVLLMGTSLGGFYALYFAAVLGLPSISINPVTRTGVMCKRLGENTNWENGRKFVFTAEHLAYLGKMEAAVLAARKDPFCFNLVIGGRDESLTYEYLDTLVPHRRTYSFFAEEPHRFPNLELIKPLLVEYIALVQANPGVSSLPSPE